MPHIDLPDGIPGIRSLFAFRPQTAAPLLALAEVLLRGESTLSRGERELIAAYVSAGNACAFCMRSHGAVADLYLDDSSLVEAVCTDLDSAPVGSKLKALLRIAGNVREGGGQVSSQDVDLARSHGASDLEIHDTVLIAAAFCMFNRYVDGLATWAPDDDASYEAMAVRLRDQGYR
ncbi:MAG TPA: peroxidase-related enzyme [Candidatus Dormibacteraeota bacterium]|nr:peroxidase-related enzyme [Candidatus Dormibacteraeota bacterium]